MTDDEHQARETAFVRTGCQGGYQEGWRDGVAYATKMLAVPADRCNAHMPGAGRCVHGVGHSAPHSFDGSSEPEPPTVLEQMRLQYATDLRDERANIVCHRAAQYGTNSPEWREAFTQWRAAWLAWEEFPH